MCSLRVKEAMHRDVTWVEPTEPIASIAKKMRDLNIGAVPVGENDRLIGMVTDRDIALRAFDGKRDVQALTARDVMTAGITYCRDDDKLKDAARIMEEKKVRRLPVLDENKRMVGILALGDIAHAGTAELSGETLAAVSAHHQN